MGRFENSDPHQAKRNAHHVHLSFGHSVEYSQVTLAGHPATLFTALRLTPNGMQSQRKQRENSEKTTRTAQGNREVRHNNQLESSADKEVQTRTPL